MDDRRLHQQWRAKQILTITLVSSLFATVGLYLLLLGSEVYSTWEARHILAQMEVLQIGDSAQAAEQALRPCNLQRFGTGFRCTIIAGPFRSERFWRPVSARLGNYSYLATNNMRWIGLRPWSMSADVANQDGKIKELAVKVDLQGRYERLGGMSIRQDEVPPEQTTSGWESESHRRTSIRWWSLIPGGESVVVILTAGSTEKELRAGKINGECLSAFHGCSALCELMPGVVPVLDERGEGFGGSVVGVPPAKCQPKNQAPCR
jgi:hypothetical protein